ncbi:MAG: DMT family transporter [Geminicoccaceae bacterium]|nr:DMT family transporter [Geminicoccaceae bacterium]MCB2011968.1 DMT family transporter [Geminicoccaceae bacterium]
MTERQVFGNRMAMAADSPLAAIGFACLAGIMFVGLNTIAKYLTGTFDTVMIIWARYFFHVLVVVILFPRTVIAMSRAGQQHIQLGRSILLLASTVCNFTALMFLPLGEVAAIIFTSPLLVAALAMTVLGEKVSPLRWAFIAAGFVGAILIVRPGFGTFNIGAPLALGCALAYALYQVSTRIVREAQPMVSLLYGGVVGMVALSIVVPFFWQWPTPVQWLLMALMGSLGAFGHLLMIMALQRAEVSRVSPFTYLQLVWAMSSSIFVFGDLPTTMTVMGAIVIVASGLALLNLDHGRAARRRRRVEGGAE